MLQHARSPRSAIYPTCHDYKVKATSLLVIVILSTKEQMPYFVKKQYTQHLATQPPCSPTGQDIMSIPHRLAQIIFTIMTLLGNSRRCLLHAQPVALATFLRNTEVS